MGVNRHPFLAIGHPLFGLRIDQFSINHVLPQVHALAMRAFAVSHPGRHFAGGTRVQAHGGIGILDAFAG